MVKSTMSRRFSLWYREWY